MCFHPIYGYSVKHLDDRQLDWGVVQFCIKPLANLIKGKIPSPARYVLLGIQDFNYEQGNA